MAEREDAKFALVVAIDAVRLGGGDNFRFALES
jgi:hypothetical protein